MANKFKANWSNYLGSRPDLLRAALSAALLAGIMPFYSTFLNFVENRPGFSFSDPVLELMPVIDFTIPLFIFVYLSIIITLTELYLCPKKIFAGVAAYFLLVVFRMASMYLLPLDPPADMIVLADPIAQIFTESEPLTRDLFFSGHTSTTFMMFLLVKNRYRKILLGIITASTAGFVLFQHVHYTIDVIAAPFFAYGAFKLGIYWIYGSRNKE
jgi:hypothetical protein